MLLLYKCVTTCKSKAMNIDLQINKKNYETIRTNKTGK